MAAAILAAAAGGPVAAAGDTAAYAGATIGQQSAAVPQSLLLRFLADDSTLTLIDARSPDEFAASHITGAVNVPHELPESYEDLLPADLDRPIVIYCKTGKRASILRGRLQARGYTNVAVLKPEQIFWTDGLAVFNCATPSVPEPTDMLNHTSAARSREEKQ